MEILNEFVRASVKYMDNCKVKITGNIVDVAKYKHAIIIAPNTFDVKGSYSGKGMPFPCAEIAFENTPNKHLVNTNGIFDVVFDYPNSFYTVANKMKIISPIYFIIVDQNDVQHIEFVHLEDMYKLRTLTNRETRTGPEFYSKKYEILPVDTAESLMMQYSLLKKEKGLA